MQQNTPSANSANNSNARKGFQHRSSSQDTPKWEAARTANANNEDVVAHVDNVATKEGRARGLNVTLACGLSSFIPGSEIPKGLNQNGLVGKDITVRVIEVNRRKARLISSIKAVTTAYIAGLQVDGEVKGVVARFKEGLGYFVELTTGVDALLHISQTALVDGKPEVLTIGQEITAKVRELNAEEGRVSLTMRKPRPENSNSGRGRQGNTKAFQDRYSRRQEVHIPKIKATPAPKDDKPKAPRVINKSAKSRKSDFTVVFDSNTGDKSPFAQLADFYASKTGADQAAEATTTVEAPAVTEAQSN